MSGGMTAEEKYHYGEYCRLRDESLAIYHEWDLKSISDKLKAPHYARAAELMRKADWHKSVWVNLGGT